MLKQCFRCLSVLSVVFVFLDCGGSNSNTPVVKPPITMLDISGYKYYGNFGQSSNPSNGVNAGIILPSGEARLLLAYGAQVVGDMQISGDVLSCSAAMFTFTGVRSFSITEGKINRTLGDGQVDISGSFATPGNAGAFNLYCANKIVEPKRARSLNNLVGNWRAEADVLTSSVSSYGYISGAIGTGGILTATLSSGGSLTAQFSQVLPGANAFRVAVQCNGQVYSGLAYTDENLPTALDAFLIVLASNDTGQFYAIFHR